ncbi:MAG TPA: MerR family transcriptional regulator [Streptosporangiaceae bacterium]
MATSDRPVYSIGAVSRLLGVPAATLRTWQERYGVVVPERSEGGHRLYSPDQVELLRFLADQVAAGLSPGDAHRLLRERLPAGPPAEEPAPPADRGVPDHIPGAGRRILVADRDRYAAEHAEYFLCGEGYRVDLSRTAADALARAAATPPDLAVVDLLISAGGGRALCAELRDRWGLPVLAVCALDLEDQARAAGASAFLNKPVDPRGLAAAVGDLLRPAVVPAQRRRRPGGRAASVAADPAAAVGR